jgi:cytochrome c peroxidase
MKFVNAKHGVVFCRVYLFVLVSGVVFYPSAQAQELEHQVFLQVKQIFKPLPKNMATQEAPITTAQVELGKKLFFDPRLSLDGTVSCAICHKPALYGTDALSKSIGVERRVNDRNAPTVLNAALQFKAHWIGDRASVEEQAMKSLIGPASFGNPDYDAVIKKIDSIPGYNELFAKAFPKDANPIRPENWGKAIGAYERTLVTPSPFDAFLEGDSNALGAEAKSGLRAFLSVGCASCHNGVAVGGSMFQKFGVVEEYWKETGSAPIDEGRFSITHDVSDRYFFKVPGLRNVAMTPPYFHDGSVVTLTNAVRVMGKVQLGQNLTRQQITAVIAFLSSLTGKLPEEFINEPVLVPDAFKPGAP